MNLFDGMAATWEANPSRADRARVVGDAIAARIPLQRTWSVVDVGSGTGLLSRALADRVGTILLVDTSPGMTEVAADQIAASGLSTLSAVCLDITGETPPGAPFDLAVSLLMLHHVKDVEAFLGSVLCRLEPGGYIAFADLAAEDGTFHEDPAEEVHHHGFEPHHLAAMATSAGFMEVTVEEVHQMVKQRNGQDRSYGLVLLTGRVPVTLTTP
jgi:2-polyprenyl-3-methyl-5-hydroxy-6-metoxy-1,4-benzoquinol methylase